MVLTHFLVAHQSKWAKDLKANKLKAAQCKSRNGKTQTATSKSVWCRSKHTRLVDNPLHDALQLVTGCLRPSHSTIFCPGRYYLHWALPKKSYTVSCSPWNVAAFRAPSSRSTPVHTNYTAARTQIEPPFCTGCAGTTERSR